MKIYLNNITGIDDAMCALRMSKRHWNPEFDNDVRSLCKRNLTRQGFKCSVADPDDRRRFDKRLETLVKWGCQHTVLLKFIDFSVTVTGLHRAGQDDWDAHAQRFNNRIVRESTRLAEFGNEVSDYYADKILPRDIALAALGIECPDEIEYEGKTYVNSVNGYILKGHETEQDVKRGLYMLSIPSNFIFKCDLPSFAHVYKMRNESTHAHPEVKQCCELICDAIEAAIPEFNRYLFVKMEV